MQGNDATEHAQERLPQQVPQLLHEARTNNSHAMHYAAMQNTEHLMTGALTIPLFRLGRRLPCSHCGALLFVHENNWGHMCCLKGQVQLQPILEVVPLPQDAPRDTMLKAAAVKSICDMWRSTNQEGNTLRKYARQLNNALAMASATAASEVTPRGGAWKPSVIICGKVYTKMGPLINSAPNSTRKFAQLWFHDPQHDVEDATIDARLQHMRLPAHITSSERDTLRLIFSKFQQWLRQCNPYVRDFQMACELPTTELEHRRLIIIHANPRETRNAGEHPGRYNRASGFKEISVCISDTTQPTQARDIVVRVREHDGALRLISETHRASDALHYPTYSP